MLLCILLTPLMLVNCGYRFSPGGEHISPDIRQVYVDTFTNDTSEAYVENYVRNGFIDQFRRTSRFTITDGKETADAVLTGSIKSIVITPLASDQFDKATQNRIWMVIRIQFKEMRSGKMIYLNPALTGEQSFLVDPAGINKSSISKSAALQKLSLDLSEAGFRSIMSGF